MPRTCHSLYTWLLKGYYVTKDESGFHWTWSGHITRPFKYHWAEDLFMEAHYNDGKDED